MNLSYRTWLRTTHLVDESDAVGDSFRRIRRPDSGRGVRTDDREVAAGEVLERVWNKTLRLIYDSGP